MKKLSTLICALLVSAFALAQNAAIGTEELSQLRSSYAHDAQTKSLHNILLGSSAIKSLSYNPELAQQSDHFFKYRVDVKGITDQKRSGRCWMFTSMNELRPLAMKRYNVSKFDFSHNFSYFYDILEKSNLFLENVIRTADRDFDDREVVTYFSSPVGDGGVWNLFFNIGEKYGVVPDAVMPETEHSNNTTQMISVINERLRKGGYDIRSIFEGAKKAKDKNIARAEEIKMQTLKDVYRVLALCLGEPPVEFTWRYKDNDGQIQTVTGTPQEFYRSIVTPDYNSDNYVMIMNDPTREYYKVYEIENYRNTVEGINWVYLNLPNDEIKKAALASIKDNQPMYASCDVGKQSNTKAGVGFMDPQLYDYAGMLGIDLAMDKKARILTRQSGSSHAMLLIGCDTDDNDVPVKWEFENSWGAASGNNGYLTFTDKWFDEYMFRIVINKKYLSDKAVKALSGEKVKLPCWDYMF